MIEERLLDVDDIWEMSHNPDNEYICYELIDGELLISERLVGFIQGVLTAKIGSHLAGFCESHNLGIVTAKTGYYSADDRHTLLGPDVAFIRYDRLTEPSSDKYVPAMPDLAVEILSPNDTMAQARRKAEAYLKRGTTLVWIVMPARKAVEVWRRESESRFHSELVEAGGKLSGGAILPGFELAIGRLFPSD